MGIESGSEELLLTETALRRYDGEDGPMLVAYQGIIYDVSTCPKWRTGLHEQLHFAGQDLSTEMAEAPHKEDVLSRSSVRRVGRLIQND